MVSNVVVSLITISSATITWTTAQSVSSTAYYGTTTSYGSSQSGGSGTSHSATITGLSSNTIYHFRLGRSSYGYSDDYTFATLSRVSNVVVSSITATTATITWTTTSSISSGVQYGLTTSYGSSQSGGSGTSHSATITGLVSSTTYHFRVGSGSDYSGDSTFTTLNMVSNVVVSSIIATTAIITWTTASSVSSGVQYGLTTSYGSSQSGGSGTSHSATITGLVSGTTYHFRVGSSSYGYTGDFTFTTLSMISNVVVSAITATTATITWTTAESTKSDLQYGINTSYGSTITEEQIT